MNWWFNVINTGFVFFSIGRFYNGDSITSCWQTGQYFFTFRLLSEISHSCFGFRLILVLVSPFSIWQWAIADMEISQIVGRLFEVCTFDEASII